MRRRGSKPSARDDNQAVLCRIELEHDRPSRRRDVGELREEMRRRGRKIRRLGDRGEETGELAVSENSHLKTILRRVIGVLRCFELAAELDVLALDPLQLVAARRSRADATPAT